MKRRGWGLEWRVGEGGKPAGEGLAGPVPFRMLFSTGANSWHNTAAKMPQVGDLHRLSLVLSKEEAGHARAILAKGPQAAASRGPGSGAAGAGPSGTAAGGSGSGGGVSGALGAAVGVLGGMAASLLGVTTRAGAAKAAAATGSSSASAGGDAEAAAAAAEGSGAAGGATAAAGAAAEGAAEGAAAAAAARPWAVPTDEEEQGPGKGQGGKVFVIRV